jgi:phosphoserine phosphatase
MPRTSGKAAVAERIASRFGSNLADALFLCDDENDVQLSLLCRRSYVVGVNAPLLASAIAAQPGRYVIATQSGTAATEEMLAAVLRDLAT